MDIQSKSTRLVPPNVIRLRMCEKACGSNFVLGHICVFKLSLFNMNSIFVALFLLAWNLDASTPAQLQHMVQHMVKSRIETYTDQRPESQYSNKQSKLQGGSKTASRQLQPSTLIGRTLRIYPGYIIESNGHMPFT